MLTPVSQSISETDVRVDCRMVTRLLNFFRDRRVVREERAVLATPDTHAEDAASSDLRVECGREEQVVDLLTLRAVLVGASARVACEVLVLGDVLEIGLPE
jgi:hypothetical protein